MNGQVPGALFDKDPTKDLCSGPRGLDGEPQFWNSDCCNPLSPGTGRCSSSNDANSTAQANGPQSKGPLFTVALDLFGPDSYLT